MRSIPAMSVFVDTSAFYAAADATDANHARVREVFDRGQPLVTSTLVLAESWRLLNRRLGRGPAHAFWAAVRDGAVETVAVPCPHRVGLGRFRPPG